MDLFEFKKKHYLLFVDYFSHYLEVVQLKSITSLDITVSLKSTFFQHGIPGLVRSDNGPQYSFLDFSKFARVLIDSLISLAVHNIHRVIV